MHSSRFGLYLALMLFWIGARNIYGSEFDRAESLKNGDSLSSLMRAVKEGDVLLVTSLLRESAKIDEVNSCGETALSIAINSRKETANTIQKILRANGARELDVRTLLRQGQIETIKKQFQMKNLAHCTYEFHDGSYSSYERFETLLGVASTINATDFLQALLTNHASVDLADQSGERPLIRAARANNSEAMRILLAANADPSIPGSFCDTPLSLAARHGNVRAVRILLEKRARIDIPSPLCASPLSGAIAVGNLEIVKMLSAAGAVHRKSLKHYEGDYTSSLRLAKELAKEKVVWIKQYSSFLLQNTGTTEAELSDRYEIEAIVAQIALRYLSQRLSNVSKDPSKINDQDETGLTLLMESAIDGMPAILGQVLSMGANTEMQNSRGMTALGYAIDAGEEACTKKLLQFGANVNHVNKRLSETPLMIAVHRRNAGLVKMLLEAKADFSLKNVEGKTALMIAEEDMDRLQKEPEIESVLDWRRRTQAVLELLKTNQGKSK